MKEIYRGDRKTAMEPSMEGHLIKQAIGTFYEDRTTDNLLEAMQVLKDNEIWVPCRREGEDAPLEPEIVQSSSGYYLPVFSGREEMSDYGEDVLRTEQLFTEAIVLARNYTACKLSGIVVNAFTTSFTLNWELLDIIEGSAEG